MKKDRLDGSRCKAISAAWRTGYDEQMILESALFNSENQHRRALLEMVEAECRAQISVAFLRAAERDLAALCAVNEEEIRRWGHNYSECEVEMALSVERAETSLLEVPPLHRNGIP